MNDFGSKNRPNKLGVEPDNLMNESGFEQA